MSSYCFCVTHTGMRRRGYTAEALNTFCETVGVSRNDQSVPLQLLEFCIRSNLDVIAARHMCVEQPVKVNITNWPTDRDSFERLKISNFPKQPDTGGHHYVTLSRTVYIDAADVRSTDVKGYFGLAPGKTVHLKYAYNITCTRIVSTTPCDPSDVNGAGESSQQRITEIDATIDFENSVKPKGNLHWVSSGSDSNGPQKVELRLYEKLFNSPDPAALGDDFLSDINLNSLRIVKTALIDAEFKAQVGDKFQFERMAYFVVDPDTTKLGHLVFNRTVALKEDKLKAAVHAAVPAPAKSKKTK